MSILTVGPSPQRLKLQAQWDERNKLHAECDKLYAEGRKLYAEGYKLRAEGDKLYAEGTLIWISAVIAEYGDIQITWTAESCILENGDVYEFPTAESK